MKKLLVLSAISLFLVACHTGCATGPTGQKTLDVPVFSVLTNFSTVATIAAKDGTIVALKAHPDWRSGFVQARDSLAVLAKNQQVNLSSVIEIVSRLDVKQLQGETAKMIAGDLRIILEDTVNGRVAIFNPQQSSDVAVLADALARGITIGLGE